MRHVMLTCMFVQDAVEKKLTNLADINTTQNKAHLMIKCHTSEAHKKGCAMMGSARFLIVMSSEFTFGDNSDEFSIFRFLPEFG